MKKLLLMACVAMLSLGAAAQNVQFHYDFGHNLYKDLKKTSESDGRAPITTTVEMFRGDTWGSTYFFIDLDYNAGRRVLIGRSRARYASGRSRSSGGCRRTWSMTAV